ncbi:MAG: phosphate-starvation-inducible PsiE family protein [Desulfuromonadales bacterium]|nr:phosphate-starvation-inducible PsiE family protein [Desulfuromonadales bacterium]
MLKRTLGNLFYHWPEKLVIVALSLMITITIFVTLAQAALVLFQTLASEQSFLNHNAFINVFGAFMTVLIAMEFNHTVFSTIAGTSATVKVRSVLLVSLLALARKVVLIDLNDYDYTSIIALAVLIAGVTLAYWVVARFETPPEETRPMIKRLLSLIMGDAPDAVPKEATGSAEAVKAVKTVASLLTEPAPSESATTPPSEKESS